MSARRDDDGDLEPKNSCKEDWLNCIRRLAVESVVIVTALAVIRVLLYPTEDPINTDRALVFVCLYIALGAVFKLCGVEFASKIASISGIELGLKMVRAI